MNGTRWSILILAVVLMAGPALADVNIAWQENFNPIKPTWSQPTATWTDVAGPTAILTQSDPGATFGKVESEPITVNLAVYNELIVSSTAIDSNTSYTVQLQEQGGAGAAINVINSQWLRGTQIVNIAQATGWSGNKTFTIVIWIGGGHNKSATFTNISLRNPQGFSYAWQDHFDPMKTTWDQPATTWIDVGGTTAILTESSPTQNYGQTESEAITANLNDYPELVVRTVAMDAACSYVVQLHEIGGSNAWINLNRQYLLGTQVFNIPALTGWTGTKTFKINIWVEGESKSITFDYIQLKKAGGTAWEDNTNPLKSTWYLFDGIWDDTPGPGAIVQENSFLYAWGKVESETLTVNVSDYPILDVVSTDVSESADYTIKIQSEEGGTYPDFACIQWYKDPNYTHHIFNIAQATGWTGLHSFRIAVWIGGENQTATFELFRLRSADPNIVWQDHMNPAKSTWNQLSATLTAAVDPARETIGGT
jgi:hypothetical protein